MTQNVIFADNYCIFRPSFQEFDYGKRHPEVHLKSSKFCPQKGELSLHFECFRIPCLTTSNSLTREQRCICCAGVGDVIAQIGYPALPGPSDRTAHFILNRVRSHLNGTLRFQNIGFNCILWKYHPCRTKQTNGAAYKDNIYGYKLMCDRRENYKSRVLFCLTIYKVNVSCLS